MPSLKKMLQPYDLDLIERIGSFWGMDSSTLDLSSASKSLCAAMQNSALVEEVIASLPPTAKEAWEFLTANPQKMTWAQFIRKFGEIREYGPAKREREAPELHPVSAAEVLWYHGLVGRAFMDLPPEPREFVFIPDDLLRFAKNGKGSPSTVFIEPVPAASIKEVLLSDSRVIDHMIDWLAAKRMKRELPTSVWECWHESEAFLAATAYENNLVDKNGEPVTESLPVFFQQDRNEILLNWMTAWQKSTRFNDLRCLPGLVFEGNWQNDPLKPRQFLLEKLLELKPDTWYDLNTLVNAIKTNQPDFQRPSGDYDSWFIRKAECKEYLRGFEHWNDIDGALIKHLISGPLYWLGLIDLGLSDKRTEVYYFRVNSLFTAILTGEKLPAFGLKETAIKIAPDLKFLVPLFSSRTLRYQIGRFCEVHSITASETSYEITADSLRRAQQGGLKPSQLNQLLEKQLKTPLPKSLTLLAEQWEKTGLAASIQAQTLIRTCSPEIMQILQANPQTAKYLVEVINPTVALLNPAGEKIIKRILMEQGLLTDIKLEV